MGKYSNSKIHDMYSDWHWQLVNIDDKYKRLYVSDIDRLWLEYNYNTEAVVAVIDLKREGADDGMTATEKGVYEWFSKKGANYYLVYINNEFTSFRVVDPENNTEQIMKSLEYADWLLSLRGNTNRLPETKKDTYDEDFIPF